MATGPLYMRAHLHLSSAVIISWRSPKDVAQYLVSFGLPMKHATSVSVREERGGLARVIEIDFTAPPVQGDCA